MLNWSEVSLSVNIVVCRCSIHGTHLFTARRWLLKDKVMTAVSRERENESLNCKWPHYTRLSDTVRRLFSIHNYSKAATNDFHYPLIRLIILLRHLLIDLYITSQKMVNNHIFGGYSKVMSPTVQKTGRYHHWKPVPLWKMRLIVAVCVSIN